MRNTDVLWRWCHATKPEGCSLVQPVNALLFDAIPVPIINAIAGCLWACPEEKTRAVRQKKPITSRTHTHVHTYTGTLNRGAVASMMRQEKNRPFPISTKYYRVVVHSPTGAQRLMYFLWHEIGRGGHSAGGWVTLCICICTIHSIRTH